MAKQSELQELARGFGLLSDPTRLAILRLLADRPRNVAAMGKALGLRQDMLGYHLGLLRMGRLIDGVRQGKSVLYQTDAAGLKELAGGLAGLTPRR